MPEREGGNEAFSAIRMNGCTNFAELSCIPLPPVTEIMKMDRKSQTGQGLYFKEHIDSPSIVGWGRSIEANDMERFIQDEGSFYKTGSGSFLHSASNKLSWPPGNWFQAPEAGLHYSEGHLWPG